MESHSNEDRVLKVCFKRSPVEVVGVDRVTGLKMAVNILEGDMEKQKAVATSEIVEEGCGLLLRSIGMLHRQL